MTFEAGAAGGIIDLMVGLPPVPGDMTWRDTLRPLLKDEESLGGFQHPASYMFKNLPSERFADDPPRPGGSPWIRPHQHWTGRACLRLLRDRWA